MIHQPARPPEANDRHAEPWTATPLLDRGCAMDDPPSLEELEAVFAGEERKVNLDLAIRRVRARIDRALETRNKRQFIELCRLLRDYQARR